MDHYKSWAELEMAEFDRLSPEWRALVREYNVFPMKGETIESYLEYVQTMTAERV